MSPQRCRPRLAVVLAALFVAGCDSAPVPQPVPDLVRLSTPTPGQPQRLLVGLPGAVAGKGQVHVVQPKTGLSLSVASTEAGTFAAVLPTADAELALTFENDDGESDPLLLRSALPDGPRPALGTPAPGVVSVPDAGGRVTVANDGGPGQPLLLDATPEVTVLVSNDQTSEVVSSTTDSAGRFAVSLLASSGSTILILLVDPDEPDVTSDFVGIQVP